MLAASPCPVRGRPIEPAAPGRDFDCPARCRNRDRAAWDAARATQLAAEIEAFLHGLARPDPPTPDETEPDASSGGGPGSL